MWWVIPFGLILGLGAVLLVVWSGELPHVVPRDIGIMLVVAAGVLGPITRPVIPRVGRWLIAHPHDRPTRFDLGA